MKKRGNLLERGILFVANVIDVVLVLLQKGEFKDDADATASKVQSMFGWKILMAFSVSVVWR